MSMENYPIHIEIQPRVHLIRGPNNARFPEANTLLIDDEILTLVRIDDKIMRIISNPKSDKMNEDPYKDIVGYGLLSMRRREEKNQK